MGFREDLDLSGIIDKFEIFGGRSDAGLPPEVLEERRRLREEREQEQYNLPQPVGSGPLLCSTGRTLATARPAFAWDPNRYYRDLGIPWPYVNATKKDLRLAFFERDGSNSRRLTYCLKQLLVHRPSYDAMPLGEIWLDDIYVQEALHQKAADLAQKMALMGDYTSVEEVLDRWGYSIRRDSEEGADSPTEDLDKDHLKRFDGADPEDSVGGTWNYAFYRWRTTRWDSDRLSAWQAALIGEIDPEVVPSLTIGLVGKQPQDFVIGQVMGDWVVFLNVDAEVSSTLAAKAAHQLHTDVQRANASRAQSN